MYKNRSKQRRFWDEFIVGNFFGLLVPGFYLLIIGSGKADNYYLYGFLGGLIAGQIVICSLEASKAAIRYGTILQVVYTILVFGNLVLFAFFPKGVGRGYLLGLLLTFFFGMAVVALIKRLAKP